MVLISLSAIVWTVASASTARAAEVGLLPIEDVHSAITQAPQVRQCLVDTTDPLPAILYLDFVVTRDGKIGDVTIRHPWLTDSSVASCLMASLGALQLPRSATPMPVQYPLQVHDLSVFECYREKLRDLPSLEGRVEIAVSPELVVLRGVDDEVDRCAVDLVRKARTHAPATVAFDLRHAAGISVSGPDWESAWAVREAVMARAADLDACYLRVPRDPPRRRLVVEARRRLRVDGGTGKGSVDRCALGVLRQAALDDEGAVRIDITFVEPVWIGSTWVPPVAAR